MDLTELFCSLSEDRDASALLAAAPASLGGPAGDGLGEPQRGGGGR
jgi:hypothetical protein